jgi:hypothetical protein
MDVSLSKENTSLQVIRILRAEKEDRVKRGWLWQNSGGNGNKIYRPSREP